MLISQMNIWVVMICRAHLNEAPEEPHRRLAAAGLLAEDMVFNDAFVTLKGADFWRDYMAQLRAAGGKPLHVHEIKFSMGLLLVFQFALACVCVQGAGRSCPTHGWKCPTTGESCSMTACRHILLSLACATRGGGPSMPALVSAALVQQCVSSFMHACLSVGGLLRSQAAGVDGVQRRAPAPAHPQVVPRLQGAEPPAQRRLPAAAAARRCGAHPAATGSGPRCAHYRIL